MIEFGRVWFFAVELFTLIPFDKFLSLFIKFNGDAWYFYFVLILSQMETLGIFL
jgi:hypothetical protein